MIDQVRILVDQRDKYKFERDTAQARIAELLRKIDELKVYCIKEKEYNPKLLHVLNEILDVLK